MVAHVPQRARLGGLTGMLRAPSRDDRLAAGLVFAIGLFHLCYAPLVGLAGDEAYYWQWARSLDWGYFDHPPMVAWLIAAGTTLLGPHEFGVRAATVILSSALLWLVYLLAKRYVVSLRTNDVSPSRAGLWAVMALAATPLFSVGGFLATPDVPFAFFWTLSVLLALRVVQNESWMEWILLGATLALGMLSKYPFGVLPFAFLIACLATSRGRTLLGTPGPWLAVATAAALLTPHVLWLARHEYAPILFQMGHGLVSSERDGLQRVGGFIQFVAGQFGVLTPILFVFFVAAVGSGLRALRGRESEADSGPRLIAWILVLPALLTLLVFGAASLFAKSQTNWPAAAWITLSVFVGIHLAHMMSAARTQRRLALAAVLIAALISAYAHLEAAHPMVPYGSSLFDKLQEKHSLAAWADALRVKRDGSGKHRVAIYADNYRTASLLAFYLPDRPATDSPFEEGSGSQYSYWRGAQASVNVSTHAWYFTRFENDPRVTTLFVVPEPVDVYIERRLGVPVGRTYAWYGRLRP
ncbi:MAG: glycosyltransferase family 39 protein [Gammaproteobacteria bacterium]|nr:glycosyltransferase family 39 protein [Gammaproteobacteria bacterium]